MILNWFPIAGQASRLAAAVASFCSSTGPPLPNVPSFYMSSQPGKRPTILSTDLFASLRFCVYSIHLQFIWFNIIYTYLHSFQNLSFFVLNLFLHYLFILLCWIVPAFVLALFWKLNTFGLWRDVYSHVSIQNLCQPEVATHVLKASSQLRQLLNL